MMIQMMGMIPRMFIGGRRFSLKEGREEGMGCGGYGAGDGDVVGDGGGDDGAGLFGSAANSLN